MKTTKDLLEFCEKGCLVIVYARVNSNDVEYGND